MKTRRWMTNLSVLYFRRNLLPPGGILQIYINFKPCRGAL